MVVAGDEGNAELLVKRYKISVTRLISSGNLMYSVVTIFNKTALCLEIC